MTKWSKFDTIWTGVRVTRPARAAPACRPAATHVVAHAEYGYTANLPLADVTDATTSIVAYAYDGERHRADARRARCASSCPTSTSGSRPSGCAASSCVDDDQPGFWERNGYHNYGDPLREQRYWGD